MDVRQRDLTGFAEIQLLHHENLPGRKLLLQNRRVGSKQSPIPPELVKCEIEKRIESGPDFPEDNLFPNLAGKLEQFKIIGMLHQSQILMEHEDGLAVGDVHTIPQSLIEVLLSKAVEKIQSDSSKTKCHCCWLKAQDA